MLWALSLSVMHQWTNGIWLLTHKGTCNWMAGTWYHFIQDCSEIQPKEAAELMYHQTFFWWNLIEAFAHLSVSSPCWGLGQYNTSDFNEFCSSTGAKYNPQYCFFQLTNQPKKPKSIVKNPLAHPFSWGLSHFICNGNMVTRFMNMDRLKRTGWLLWGTTT